MANDNNTPDPSLTDEQQADKFQGFSTRDGEVTKPAQQRAAPAAKAQAAPAAGDDEDADEAAAAAAEGRAPKHKDAQKRIDKAVAKQRAAERERDDLRAQLNGRAQPQQQVQQQPAGPKQIAKEPQPADYAGGEYDAAYLKDTATWAGQQAAAQAAKGIDDKQAKRDADAAAKEFNRILSAFEAKGEAAGFQDFKTIVHGDDVQITEVVGSMALDSEWGPAIIYNLALDPDEQARVSAMTPTRQAAWFGRREAELSSESPDADDADGSEEQDIAEEAKPAPAAKRPSKATRAPLIPTAQARGQGGTTKVDASTTDFASFERLAKGAAN